MEKSLRNHVIKRLGFIILICAVGIISFIVENGYRRFSFLQNSNGLLIIIIGCNLLIGFFLYLIVEAFKFNRDERKYRMANFYMVLICILIFIIFSQEFLFSAAILTLFWWKG